VLCIVIFVLYGAVPVLHDAVLVNCNIIPVLCDHNSVLYDAA
jgi:hypothetical protein